MNRRKFIVTSASGLIAGLIPLKYAASSATKNSDHFVKLIQLDIPSPRALRGGWAAMASIYAARGWVDSVYATSKQWFYHDGGGNWVCLRIIEKNKIVLIGHDHEYSETYFGEAAKYFGEEETDLLTGGPEWWARDLDPKPFGDWIGFIYGWDGNQWQRSNYEKDDGFKAIGLLEACSVFNTDSLKLSASDAPGLNGKPPSDVALNELVNADAKVTPQLLEAVVPGWNIEAGVAAARKFLQAEID